MMVLVTEWLQNMAKYLPFHDTQTKMLDISNKAPGSGKWLIESPEFREWRNGQTGKLLCHGDCKTYHRVYSLLYHWYADNQFLC